MQRKVWAEAKIFQKIAVNPAFDRLEQESEIFSFGETEDYSLKRTSGVTYFTNKNENLIDSSYARLHNCRAYFRNGLLNINIGVGNGFSSWGVVIFYKEKKFYTEPYHTTDLIIPDESQPFFEIINQELTLDKGVYKLGDSLYGKINFKIVENDPIGNKINHTGNGYFRTVVREL